jgi:hypothetical protein
VMGAYPLITQSGFGPSSFQIVNRPVAVYAASANQGRFNLGVSCTVSDGASLTYTVEVTDDPIPSAGGDWVDHDVLNG